MSVGPDNFVGGVQSTSRSRDTLIWDLDNTLVDTYHLYEEAWDSFSRFLHDCIGVSQVRALEVVKAANVEVARLKGFGNHHYFPEMMVLAAERLYLELGYFPPEDLTKDLRTKIRQMGYKIFRSKGRIKAHALDVLRSLREDYNQIIYTMGDWKVQWGRVVDAGLHDEFGHANVHIVPIKTTTRLNALLQKLGLHPSDVWIVGDSYTSDILPALDVGARPIWLKSGNLWAYDHAQLPEGATIWEVHTLEEIPQVLQDYQEVWSRATQTLEAVSV